MKITIQDVSEIRVLILTSGRLLQFMKFFAIFGKVFQDFLPPNFYQTSRFVRLTSIYFLVTMRILILIV
jgi:hypothetical protein